MTKEQVYDEKVFPLMAQVIAICREHKIAMFASFSTPSASDPDLHVTTCLTEKDYEPSDALIRARNALFAYGPQLMALRITTAPEVR